MASGGECVLEFFQHRPGQPKRGFGFLPMRQPTGNKLNFDFQMFFWEGLGGWDGIVFLFEFRACVYKCSDSEWLVSGEDPDVR